MNKALDDHARAVAPIGDNQPEFAKIVKDAKEDARSTVDQIFDRKVSFEDLTTGDTRKADLRELVAEAKNTQAGSRRRDPSAEWQNVNRGMVALMKELSSEATTGDKATQKLAETQAVRNIAQIIAAASPHHDLSPDVDPYLSTVNSAADQVLVQSSVDAVNAAADGKNADFGHTIPELQELTKQTEGIDPTLTIQRVQGSQSAIDTAMTDLFQQSITFGSGPVMQDLPKVKSGMNDLTILADRMSADEGKGSVEDIASSVVRVIDQVSEKSDDSSKSLAVHIGIGLRDSIAGGAKSGIGKGNRPAADGQGCGQIPTQVPGDGHPQSGRYGRRGVEEKRNVNRQGFLRKGCLCLRARTPEHGDSNQFSHSDGVESLLESQKSLVDRTDHYGKAIVLTAAATQDLPKELQGLDGADRFGDAGKDLREGINKDIVSGKGEKAEINFLPLLRQYSPGAAVTSQQVAADQARARLQDLPEQDLDKLVEELGRLPTCHAPSAPRTSTRYLRGPEAVALPGSMR